MLEKHGHDAGMLEQAAVRSRVRRIHRVLLLAGVLLGLIWVAAGCRGDEEATIPLDPQAGSGQSGEATLTATGSQTLVVVKVSPGPQENDPQPLHIHFGQCGANLGNVRFSLEAVVAGESRTVLDASLSSLRDGNSAINLHESLPGIRTYTACGTIPSE
ncbi:MAG: hypothetical protein IIC95_06295 [Chloroflexi bacterium]|nr:hypothetical protein [Chloroflexota bacterium]